MKTILANHKARKTTIVNPKKGEFFGVDWWQTRVWCSLWHKTQDTSFKVRQDMSWMKVAEELHEMHKVLMTNSSNIGNSISWPHPLASMEIPFRWCLTMPTENYCGFPQFSHLHMTALIGPPRKIGFRSPQLQWHVDEKPNRAEEHIVSETPVFV